MWPWIVGLAALILLPLLFMRRDRGDETAALTDTSALVDTAAQFGGRTTGSAAGAIAADSGTSARATSGAGAGGALLRDTTARMDSTTRGDSLARRDTTLRP